MGVVTLIVMRLIQQFGFAIVPGVEPMTASIAVFAITVLFGSTPLFLGTIHNGGFAKSKWDRTALKAMVAAFVGNLLSFVVYLMAVDKMGLALSSTFALAGALCVNIDGIWKACRVEKTRRRAILQLAVRVVIITVSFGLALLHTGSLSTEDLALGLVYEVIQGFGQWLYLTAAYGTLKKRNLIREGLSGANFAIGLVLAGAVLLVDNQKFAVITTPVHLKIGQVPLWAVCALAGVCTILLAMILQARAGRVLRGDQGGVVDAFEPLLAAGASAFVTALLVPQEAEWAHFSGSTLVLYWTGLGVIIASACVTFVWPLKDVHEDENADAQKVDEPADPVLAVPNPIADATDVLSEADEAISKADEALSEAGGEAAGAANQEATDSQGSASGHPGDAGAEEQ
ncbi:hypothetical protein ACQPZP_02575 [Spirillospora sp. CA-142024]|uniref:hypothetical protein n=1 Tax=Spirillospora sp. CA-142024 TaxID=3240036 RepID=UPI003D8F6D9A